MNKLKQIADEWRKLTETCRRLGIPESTIIDNHLDDINNQIIAVAEKIKFFNRCEKE